MAGLRELLFREDQQSAVAEKTAEQLDAAVENAEAKQSGGPAGQSVSGTGQSSKGTGPSGSEEHQSLSLSHSVLSLVPGAQTQSEKGSLQSLKQRIHRKLVENIDISALTRLEGTRDLEAAIERTVHFFLDEENLPLTAAEQQKLARDVLNETLGLGPLEPLLSDLTINDILVNKFDSVWIDRHGKLVLTDIKFKDEEHLVNVINRIVSRVGRRVDESSPIVDARLPDGSRVNAIIPPLAIDGPILSIRRFRSVPFSFEDLIKFGTISDQMAEFLSMAVRARLNILIAGGTSAGKTTLLNVLSGYISNEERIVTIEDTAELRLQQRHVLRLESRPANVEGQGSISQRELVKNALRMRPDRIVVGEVRGPEALDMLQAMNTGHEGSLTTIHANSPRDAISRLETLVLLSGIELSQRSIREQIGAAFDLIVQVKRLTDGTRRVVSVTEVSGVQEGVVSLQELFTYRQFSEEDSDGAVGHMACGLRPQCLVKFKEAGIELPAQLFQPPTKRAEDDNS
jgi:pilus assembly protein CpaF